MHSRVFAHEIQSRAHSGKVDIVTDPPLVAIPTSKAKQNREHNAEVNAEKPLETGPKQNENARRSSRLSMEGWLLPPAGLVKKQFSA